MTPTTSTLVTTAEGKVTAFEGAVAKLIVAHPRLSALIALVLGGIIGHVL